jgi:hypothetical protein
MARYYLDYEVMLVLGLFGFLARAANCVSGASGAVSHTLAPASRREYRYS